MPGYRADVWHAAVLYPAGQTPGCPEGNISLMGRQMGTRRSLPGWLARDVDLPS